MLAGLLVYVFTAIDFSPVAKANSYIYNTSAAEVTQISHTELSSRLLNLVESNFIAVIQPVKQPVLGLVIPTGSIVTSNAIFDYFNNWVDTIAILATLVFYFIVSGALQTRRRNLRAS